MSEPVQSKKPGEAESLELDLDRSSKNGAGPASSPSPAEASTPTPSRPSAPARPASATPAAASPQISIPPTPRKSLSNAAPEKSRGPGSAIGAALGALAGLLVRATSVAKKSGGKALTDFNRRPEHTRWRAYAFGSYSLICLVTFAFQAWEPNSLAAYVKVQPVSLPDVTVIFVRNDGKKIWKDVRLTLNGLYTYERNDLPPGGHVVLKVDRFAVYDSNGKATFAPRDIILKDLAIDCDRGHHEVELK